MGEWKPTWFSISFVSVIDVYTWFTSNIAASLPLWLIEDILLKTTGLKKTKQKKKGKLIHNQLGM